MTGRAGGNGPGSRDAVPPGSRAPGSSSSDASPTPLPEAGPFRRVVRIVNPLGLHHRVADRFSRSAGQFACTVTVSNGAARADGKSLWDLILLVALPGADVILEVDGPDAAAALGVLADILAAPGGEDYTI